MHGVTIKIYQNFIQKKIKSGLKSGNACCHAVQNLLSFILPSKNIKTEMYGTIMLPAICMGVKLGSSH